MPSASGISGTERASIGSIGGSSGSSMTLESSTRHRHSAGPYAGCMTMICQVTTTVDSVETAQTLARGAVKARAAACGQVSGPISSVYWWERQVETAQEWGVVFKTTTERYPDL